MSRAHLRAGVIAVAAGLAGFGLQSIAINSVQQIWPGRMLTLPVAILLGPMPGVVATAIALFTSSPGLVASSLLEAAAIGYAARHRYSPLLVGAVAGSLRSVSRTPRTTKATERAQVWPTCSANISASSSSASARL